MNQMSVQLSLSDCCCDMGKGWGDASSCQLCPIKGTRKSISSSEQIVFCKNKQCDPADIFEYCAEVCMIF